MRTRPRDPLDVLLPGVDPIVGERLAKLVTFLRLLACDGHPARSGTVHVDFEHARIEMDAIVGATLAGTLEDLLLHHVAPALGAGSFAWWGTPERDVQASWSALDEHRLDEHRPEGHRLEGCSDAVASLPGVPQPDEPALAVAERLLAALADAPNAPPGRASLWRARVERARSGPRAGEAAHLELLAGEDELDPLVRIAAAGGVAECLLDRGAVRRAHAWLDERLELVSCSERLARLYGWACLLAGDPAAARETLGALPVWRGPLPAALAELRERVPQWVPMLSGRAPSDAQGGGARDVVGGAPVADRGELGAAVLGVFALGAGCETVEVALDVAPGLRERVAAWLGERDDVCSSPSTPEHRMVVTARPVVAHSVDGADALRGTLAPAARALALVPVRDDAGEVAGWVHVELEHHLVPAAARLTALARAWRETVLAAVRAPDDVRSAPRAELFPREPDAEDEAPVEADPASATARARALAELVGAFGMKLAQRRWWGFVVEGEAPALVARDGGALGDWTERRGGGRALARALRTGGVVAFDEPDPSLALHADASSGVVLPLKAHGRVCALVAVESIRRRDFRSTDVERYRAHAESRASVLRVAQFRDWHRARFGHDVYFDASCGGFAACVGDLVHAGRTRAPLALSGPAGAGKQVLARWMHYESDGRDGPFVVFPCGAFPEEGEVARLFGPGEDGAGGLVEQAAGGTLVLDDVDRLAPDGQAVLASWLAALDARARSRADVRVVVTSRVAFGSGAPGPVREDLAARLDRLQLHVPSLAERRDEIPPLVAMSAERFAAEERVRPPAFADDALALLWRQPWPGNVRQLENLVYKLVLLHAGAAVGPDDVRALARRFKLALIARIPSRRPGAAIVRAALRVTRKGTGASNKTRAARYLGWDPDTLVARMKDLGIDEEDERAPPL